MHPHLVCCVQLWFKYLRPRPLGLPGPKGSLLFGSFALLRASAETFSMHSTLVKLSQQASNLPCNGGCMLTVSRN